MGSLFSKGNLTIPKLELPEIRASYLFPVLAIALLPCFAVVLLDTLIVKTGMAGNTLFSGAELRETTSYSNISLLVDGLLSPVISQLFITGYVLNSLIRNKTLSIPVNGLLYGFINFNLGMGYLGLGMISAGLLRVTGSLFPTILFSIGCAFAKILILTTYPRITTILVFLV